MASFVGEGRLKAVQMLRKRWPRPHLLFLLCLRDTSALTGGGPSLMTRSVCGLDIIIFLRKALYIIFIPFIALFSYFFNKYYINYIQK